MVHREQWSFLCPYSANWGAGPQAKHHAWWLVLFYSMWGKRQGNYAFRIPWVIPFVLLHRVIVGKGGTIWKQKHIRSQFQSTLWRKDHLYGWASNPRKKLTLIATGILDFGSVFSLECFVQHSISGWNYEGNNGTVIWRRGGSVPQTLHKRHSSKQTTTKFLVGSRKWRKNIAELCGGKI